MIRFDRQCDHSCYSRNALKVRGNFSDRSRIWLGFDRGERHYHPGASRNIAQAALSMAQDLGDVGRPHSIIQRAPCQCDHALGSVRHIRDTTTYGISTGDYDDDRRRLRDRWLMIRRRLEGATAGTIGFDQ